MRSLINAIVILLLLVSSGALLAEPGFVFDRVQVDMRDDNVLIDADVRYQLSESTLEALEHGVPLTFELHVQLRRADSWIWNRDVLEARLRSVLRYHPLSALYELHDLQTGGHQSYATRDAALRALGKIRNFPVTVLSDLVTGETYKLRMKSFLDINALPLPLRPKAYLSPDWDLESEVWEWRLQP